MSSVHHVHKLSTELQRLESLCRSSNITFGTLLKNLSSRGHALVTLLLSFPFFLPIPIPGASILFGLVIAIAGFRMSLGKGPWIPKRWLSRQIPATFLSKVFRAGAQVMKRVELVAKPRGRMFHTQPGLVILNGALIGVCGLLLALPLPPGTNFPPAIAIALLSIGILEEDGVFVILGYCFFAINVAFFALLPILGFKGIQKLFRTF